MACGNNGRILQVVQAEAAGCWCCANGGVFQMVEIELLVQLAEFCKHGCSRGSACVARLVEMVEFSANCKRCTPILGCCCLLCEAGGDGGILQMGPSLLMWRNELLVCSANCGCVQAESAFQGKRQGQGQFQCEAGWPPVMMGGSSTVSVLILCS